jgi:hypothetical protein
MKKSKRKEKLKKNKEERWAWRLSGLRSCAWWHPSPSAWAVSIHHKSFKELKKRGK